MPQGWTDEQAPGHYRLKKRDDESLFGFVVGPHSWKKYLFPPKTTLLSAERTESGWQFITRSADTTKFALLGVRACELAAMRIQDQVFLDGPYQDPLYRERREQLFVIAVNCTQAASTCFCTSMKTGPRCEKGFDLALTEIDSGFLCEVGSERGREVLDVFVNLARRASEGTSVVSNTDNDNGLGTRASIRISAISAAASFVTIPPRAIGSG